MREDDAAGLTALVRASHGYDTREQRAYITSVTMTTAYLCQNHSTVATAGDELVGFYTLIRRDHCVELDMFFVLRRHAGQGVGRALFEQMQREARALGASGVLIISNPASAGFYLRMGARLDGEEPPAGRVRWVRPRLWLALDPAR